MAAPEVFREVGVVIAQASEVDDAAHSRGRRRIAEVYGLSLAHVPPSRPTHQ